MSKSKPTPAVSLFSEFEEKPVVAKQEPKRKRKKSEFTLTKDLLAKYQVVEANKHISHEFQSFGCHLAEVLADKQHTSLYIKLAKSIPRGTLERALSFVIDSNARNKARLFMWKLEQLKKDKEQ